MVDQQTGLPSQIIGVECVSSHEAVGWHCPIGLLKLNALHQWGCIDCSHFQVVPGLSTYS